MRALLQGEPSTNHRLQLSYSAIASPVACDAFRIVCSNRAQSCRQAKRPLLAQRL
ncbi:hypothetical protein PISMIDRAFT_673505 [Pisolithus microcarpus 441]|uniref:Uncharacterized protein n=1 Tax=Pisolithus microcarpus 441 TaxID=765257 RepID=A0A0C9ZR24_9AGAM|nr:hypothetical protein PISMIDRAFT_673505 [Pisolithus microcarpus 441]